MARRFAYRGGEPKGPPVKPPKGPGATSSAYVRWLARQREEEARREPDERPEPDSSEPPQPPEPGGR